jgi:hypothetical protein
MYYITNNSSLYLEIMQDQGEFKLSVCEGPVSTIQLPERPILGEQYPGHQMCIDLSYGLFAQCGVNVDGLLFNYDEVKSRQFIWPITGSTLHNGPEYGTEHLIEFSHSSGTCTVGKLHFPICHARLNYSHSTGGGLISVPENESKYGGATKSGALLLDSTWFHRLLNEFEQQPGNFLRGMYDGAANALTPRSPTGQEYLRNHPLAPFPGIPKESQFTNARMVFARFLRYVSRSHHLSSTEEDIVVLNLIAEGIGNASGLQFPIIPGDEERLVALDKCYKERERMRVDM